MDDIQRLEIIKARLSRLKQYKNCSAEELNSLALKKLEEKKARKALKQRVREAKKVGDFDNEYDLMGEFTTKTEKKLASALLASYLKDYTIETIADRNTLKEIIYLEVNQIRLQEKLNEFFDQKTKTVPIDLIEIIHKNSDAIIKLKNTLGLNKSKEAKKEAYDVLQHLFQRAEKWRAENQGSRTLVCPHCSKMVLLKIRTTFYDTQKHPFFKDKILYNAHLIKLYTENKLSRDDVAKVLEVSPDYVDWLVEKVWKANQLPITVETKKEDK